MVREEHRQCQIAADKVTQIIIEVYGSKNDHTHTHARKRAHTYTHTLIYVRYALQTYAKKYVLYPIKVL